MKDKSFFIKSYGCQMNEYDSEKISSLLLKDGYSNISDINKADLIVFNTCNIFTFTLNFVRCSALIAL